MTSKLEELDVEKAYVTFMFPFAFYEKQRHKMMETLERHHFKFFKLKNNTLQAGYYGKGVRVRHEQLSQFFLPYIEDKLFPQTTKNRGFLRYSKEINEEFTWEFKEQKSTFVINSVDITLCPFGIGLITIRTLKEGHENLSEFLQFVSHFRVLEPKLEEEQGVIIYNDSYTFETTNQLVLDHLCPSVKPFIIRNEHLEGYYGSLPFFEDARMLSSIFLVVKDDQEILEEHLYRVAQVDGKIDGYPYISSTNPNYIEQFVEKRVHNRWAPFTYTIISENVQATVTKIDEQASPNSISDFMGTMYYNLLLHYYYKIMLLKLSFEHSEVSWSKDKEYVRELMELISKFYSRYYFGQVSPRQEGKELTHLLREAFNLNHLFIEVKKTLDDLYRAQDNQTSNRHNMLLFMLTVYTTISGIYGMNLVIEDWKGFADWSKVPGYSFFEWISLITALSGIGLSLALLISTGGKGLANRYRKWKRERTD
ncbi:hypothetical protein NSQ95_18020 [Psychrobacillus sp. FSL W7-1457]|uniref:hypothetical protein n=1 Tax=unclassified Psychrobacillus TaxID=2636677 RepID=UPI0030FB4E92